MTTKFMVFKEVPHRKKGMDPYWIKIGKAWEPVPGGNLFLREAPLDDAGKKIVMEHLLKENHLVPRDYRFQCIGILEHGGVLSQRFDITKDDIKEFKKSRFTQEA